MSVYKNLRKPVNIQNIIIIISNKLTVVHFDTNIKRLHSM